MKKFVDPHDPYRFRKKAAAQGAAIAFIEDALARETNDCILFPFGRNSDGYARLKHKGRDTYGHVIVCERAHGPRPSNEHIVAHGCGKPACVNKRHVRWATQAENAQDRVRHGTNRKRPLSQPDVEFIGKLAQALRYRDVAKMYGASGSTVAGIVKRTAGGGQR